jgi:hypothetical protein
MQRSKRCGQIILGLVALLLTACGPATPLPDAPLYVLAGESINSGKNRLTVVDRATQEILHTAALPRSLAVNLDRDPQGRLWIGFIGHAGFVDDRLRIYAPDGSRLKELQPCLSPTGTGFAAGRAFVACQDMGFQGKLVVMNLATLEVERTIDLNLPHGGLLVGATAATADYVLVTGGTEGPADAKSQIGMLLLDAHRVELVTPMPTIEAIGTDIDRIIPYEGRFYLLNGGNWKTSHAHEADVFVLEPGSPPTVTTLNSAPAPLWGDIADGVLYAYHEQKRHLGDINAPCLISRLDLATGAVETWPMPDGWGGSDLRIIDGEVLLARHGPGVDGVYRFDPGTGSVTLLVEVPNATRLAGE